MFPTPTTPARRSLKVLICGGGCAGPALAFWLARAGHQPVVVERFPSLRVAGAQIDLRGEGISVVRRMGLHDEVYSKLVHEKGASLVDSKGKTRAFFPANTSGKGVQSITSEYEIMRGDMVQILYDATKDKVEYQFGKSLDHFEQDDKQVVAHFSDGSTDTFDLLVGADGQGSRIRKAIMPPGAPEPYHRVGAQIAYWMIPRIASDENVARAYNAPGGRMITLRSHSATECQVYVILRENTEEAMKIHRASIEAQKQFWASKIQDAGWQSERFIEGMKTTDNFYSLEVVHVRLDKWHKGRVVLLGDAGYCPSPFSAMGTSAALAGAYVLAGEIVRNVDNPAIAFENYQEKLRPLVKEIQDYNYTAMRLLLPKSQFGISALHAVAGLACYFRLPERLAQNSPEPVGRWKLPDYPELASD